MSMNRRLLKAAIAGVATLMKDLASQDPAVLLGTTPQGNTCLHISAIHGHQEFCTEAVKLNPLLLAAINADGATPLLAAVANGHVSLASVMFRCCCDQQLSETILKQDECGCNILHHAIRNGHRELALELIEAQPALSGAVNQYGESPMYIAVMRKYEDIFDKLLDIPNSAHGGAHEQNALHAAVTSGNTAIVEKIMNTRPALAREEDGHGKTTPIHMAAIDDKIEVLRELLKHDPSLGYIVSTAGESVFAEAAYRGHTGLVREFLKHCPDAPCTVTSKGWTCLHMAVLSEKTEFVEFVLGLPQLRGLVNMRDLQGNTALHLAILQCNPKIVAALLLHPDIDITLLNRNAVSPLWMLSAAMDSGKTLNWNEVSMLMLKADPEEAASILNLHKLAKAKVTNSSIKDIRSLTQTYTSNTSLVAILIATITFAAAFTLPGGYSSDPGNEGLPIMARKFAFKAFLVSDTLAMCSSLAVAFICVIVKWEDLEFLLYYKSFTRKLMWFAYAATTTAFATGLYTVLAPHLLWLAVVVCVLTSLLPILTKFLGEWPILSLRFRLGRTFKSELLDMV